MTPLSRAALVAVPAASGLALVGVQLGPMLALSAPDFGVFSLAYLLFALGTSVSLSLVCEPRTPGRSSDDIGGVSWDESWHSYSAVLTTVSVAFAVVVLLPIASITGPVDGVIAALATFTAVHWHGVRYYELGRRQLTRVVLGDALGGAAAVVAWVAIAARGGGNLTTALVIWLVTGVLAVAVGQRLPAWDTSTVGSWIRDRRESIRHLARDSAVMDLSAIGTPLVLAPLLGAAGFGVYRGVSNLAAPVRLLLNPARPLLGAWGHTVKPGRLAIVFGAAGAATGLLGYAALRVVAPHLPTAGVLTEVAALAAPTGLFIAASLTGHAAYIVVRTGHTVSGMIVPRLWQTGLGVAGPFAGLALAGLPGAVWGFAVATAVSAFQWLRFMVRARA